MAEAGIDDILIAYPVVGRSKVERVAGLLERGTKLTVALDHIDVARGLSDVMTARGLKPFRFVMDPGADFSMMPLSQAERLGLDLRSADQVRVAGIDGVFQDALVGDIALRIGQLEVQIPCLFSSNPSTPYLIGRMGFFSRFNVTFDNGRKRIVLESIGS